MGNAYSVLTKYGIFLHTTGKYPDSLVVPAQKYPFRKCRAVFPLSLNGNFPAAAWVLQRRESPWSRNKTSARAGSASLHSLRIPHTLFSVPYSVFHIPRSALSTSPVVWVGANKKGPETRPFVVTAGKKPCSYSCTERAIAFASFRRRRSQGFSKYFISFSRCISPSLLHFFLKRLKAFSNGSSVFTRTFVNCDQPPLIKNVRGFLSFAGDYQHTR